jgi:hypothetical protein
LLPKTSKCRIAVGESSSVEVASFARSSLQSQSFSTYQRTKVTTNTLHPSTNSPRRSLKGLSCWMSKEGEKMEESFGKMKEQAEKQGRMGKGAEGVQEGEPLAKNC